MDCLFCKIIAGEIPSAKVYEDEHCYAFKDVSPQTPSHVLIVPKKHVSGLNDTELLPDDSLAACVRAAAKVPRGTAWCPTAAPMPARACSTCISMCWAAGKWKGRWADGGREQNKTHPGGCGGISRGRKRQKARGSFDSYQHDGGDFRPARRDVGP